MASSIEDKLPTTKKVNPNNKLKLTRSTLFDEVTWGAAMSSYILSCGNIKPEGWIAIEKEALAFVKVNSHRNVSVLLDDARTSTQVNDDEHEHGNLIEDSDDAEDEEEVPHNGVRGITQGDESPSGSEGGASYSDYYSE